MYTGFRWVSSQDNIETYPSSDHGLTPQMHLFAGSRAPWFEITDGLPQWEAYPARA